MKKVAVLMGSDSDMPVVQKTFDTLEKLQIPFEAHIMSAHRTPHRVSAIVGSAEKNGFGVIIAAAGMAAHLAGAVAANTLLPVIGIPCKGGAADGLDALLSTVQMPPGIPVATVGLGGGVNAAILAAQMLALGDASLAERLLAHRTEMSTTIAMKDTALQEKLAAGPKTEENQH